MRRFYKALIELSIESEGLIFILLNKPIGVIILAFGIIYTLFECVAGIPEIGAEDN